MALQLRILGWRARNLRGYLRSADIRLDPDSAPIALLQMPNGTGKTTTMSLIRTVLSGRRPVDIASFRGSDSASEGFFELRLKLDEDLYTVGIRFEFNTREAFFYTDGLEGREHGHNLPTLVADTLRRGVTELFVFDGELAARMIEEGARDADNSLEVLYGLDALGDVASTVERLKDKRRQRVKDITTASAKHSVEKAEKEASDAKAALARLEAEQVKLEKGIADKRKRQDEITARIEQLGLDDKEFKARQQKVIEQRTKAKADKATASDLALTSFRSPLSISPVFPDRLARLSETLESRNLPRSSSTFFTIIAGREKCICGRDLEEKDRAHILEHAEDYLGEEEVTVINEIRYLLPTVMPSVKSFRAIVEDLRDADARLRQADQEQDRINEEAKKVGRQEIEALTKERDEIGEKLVLEQNALRFLTESIGQDVDWRTNVHACRRRFNDLQERYETAAGTRDYMEAADLLIKAANSARQAAKARLRERIKGRTNKNLDAILTNEPLRVERIEGSLHLRGEGDMPKGGASEGQKLAVCYAFLTALLSEAPFGMPFIVDSPAVSLDLTLRATVGSLIPPLFEQLIVFVISSEREGFADAFKDNPDAMFKTISLARDTGEVVVHDDPQTFFTFQSGDAR